MNSRKDFFPSPSRVLSECEDFISFVKIITSHIWPRAPILLRECQSSFVSKNQLCKKGGLLQMQVDECFIATVPKMRGGGRTVAYRNMSESRESASGGTIV